KAPHNSYFQFGAAYEVAEQKGYDVAYNDETLEFLEDTQEITGEDANFARINYYPNEPIVEFEYDETDQKYFRINDGELTVELDSEIPIQIDNVLIVESEHQVIDE